jgi:hypothetical protein
MLDERIVYHADALKWLEEQKSLKDCSIVTSLPDISEFPKMNLAEWKLWFVNAASLVLSKSYDDGLVIFFQTDIKKDGEWIDKGFLCQTAAASTGHTLVAKKVVCRSSPGTVGFGRPAYSHLLCFSKNIRPDVAMGFADVLPEAGEKTWTRGMGIKACELACQMISKYTSTRSVLDPFCGHGTVLAVANAMGMKAIGVDHSLKCVKKARSLQVDSQDYSLSKWALNHHH